MAEIRMLAVEAANTIVVLSDPVPAMDGWILVASHRERWEWEFHRRAAYADRRFIEWLAGLSPICPPQVRMLDASVLDTEHIRLGGPTTAAAVEAFLGQVYSGPS